MVNHAYAKGGERIDVFKVALGKKDGKVYVVLSILVCVDVDVGRGGRHHIHIHLHTTLFRAAASSHNTFIHTVHTSTHVQTCRRLSHGSTPSRLCCFRRRPWAL